MQYGSLILKYKKEILIWFILTLFVLPLKSIGFSTHTANVLLYVKEGLTNERKIQLLFSMGIIILIWVMTHVFSMIQYRLVIHTDLNFQSDIKRGLYSDYLKKYTNNYEISKTGEIITSLEEMPYLFGNALRKCAISVLPYAIAVVVISFYFFWVDWRLGLGCLFFVMSMVLTIFLLYPHLQKLSVDEYKTRESLNNMVYDRMGTLLRTIASNSQKKEESFFKKKEILHRRAHGKARVAYWKYHLLLYTILFVFIVGILVCYYFLFTTQKPTSKKLISSFLVFFSFLSYLSILNFNFIELMNDYAILNEHNNKNSTALSVTREKRVRKNFIKGVL